MDEFDEMAGIRDDMNGSAAGDRNAYSVEHLATFTVTRETGIVYPADGMRRLLQLEKSNGIWSQKMQLCLDGQWVLIMDYESGSIMERFPVSLIQEPTAFTSPDPVELYNNILAFIVGAPPDRGGRSPSPRREMHIFQCHNINAQDLVEDLKMLNRGVGSGGRLSRIESETDAAGREFAIEREREREADLNRSRRGPMTAQLAYRGSDSEAAAAGHEDEVSSTSSDRLYEQDIAILNRCFDDIEKFIARLQHAAAASRELERRRRSRKSKKNSDAGEGMLALRTRPPPERDFADILQKFKLSFNLLARLRAHIHDPNAPELVHFLFTPLALIVDASHDASHDGRLASRVVQPLLTGEALNLLANCVTSKETELWHSLGDPWLIPREQWKSPVPLYQPVFMDGWTPDYQVDDQPIQRPSPRRSDVGPAPFQQLSGDDQDPYGEQFSPYSTSRVAKPPAARAGSTGPGAESESAGSSPERELLQEQRTTRRFNELSLDADRSPAPNDEDDELGSAWAREAAARGARIVRVTYPRTANNDKELTVVRGEYLEILDDSRKWWKARNRRGVTAHVPHTIVAPAGLPTHEPNVYPNPVYTGHFQETRRSDASSPGAAGSAGGPTASADWVRRERLGKKGEFRYF